MGWNNLEIEIKDHPLKNITENEQYYFVHSYALSNQVDQTIAYTTYNQIIPAIIGKKIM